MRSFPSDFLRRRRAVFLTSCLGVALSLAGPAARGDALSSAKLTAVIKDVRLLPAQAAPRAAVVSDEVGKGTAVRTGLDSRAELTFTDLTITRMGQNTVFSFNEGSRDVNLGSGAILVQIPPKAPAVKIYSGAATCAVTGGTAMLESNAGHPNKIMILEGSGYVCSKQYPDECQTLLPGQMLLVTDGHLGQPMKFNAKLVYETSKLLSDFPALPNDYLIIQTIESQQTDTGTPPPGRQNNPIDKVDQASAANGAPTPPPVVDAKFGPPPTITSPDPYVIGSGTTIVTDPTITTNGVTERGTIYRDRTQDGFPTEFLFGSATAFDQMVLDGAGDDGPFAVFKFSNLELTEDPVISTGNGGPTNLALASVGQITTNGSETTLTFPGVDHVFLGTQDSSIQLGLDVAFVLPELEIYARGANSDLILNSDVNAEELGLAAGHSITVNSFVDVDRFNALAAYDFSGGIGTIVVGSEIDIEALHDIFFNTSQFQVGSGSARPQGESLPFGHSLMLAAGNDVNINVDGDENVFSEAASINVNGGHAINITGDLEERPNVPLEGPPGHFHLQLNPTDGPALFSAGPGGINADTVEFSTVGGLLLQSEGDINISGASIPFVEGTRTLDGGIEAEGNVFAWNSITSDHVDAGGFIQLFGNLEVNTASAGTDISVGERLSAQGVTAGGDIETNQLASLDTTADTVDVLSGGIVRYQGDAQFASDEVHTINASRVTSGGGINFDGLPAGGDFSMATNGGSLVVNVDSITFGQKFPAGRPLGGELGYDITGPVTFNGGDGSSAFPAGNGGHFTVNAVDDIVVDSDIEATTGYVMLADPPSGSGGSVALNSANGAVSVSSRVEVSSDDEVFLRGDEGFPPIPVRRSNSGGTINLTSGAASGTAINISSSAQLLALLDSAATGSGGVITIKATGADAAIHSSGVIRADTVKIGALGTNGTLTIGGGEISADTLLKLYAGGSNGSIIFAESVSLNGNSTKIIAANTVTIVDDKIVTIGGTLAAAVYTNNANYASLDMSGQPTGGNGSTTGKFAGAGATTSAFSSAPPFDPPPPPRPARRAGGRSH